MHDDALLSLNAIRRAVSDECTLQTHPTGGATFHFDGLSIDLFPEGVLPDPDDIDGIQTLADRIRGHRPARTVTDLDARIDELHGDGAAAELDRAIADGSIFAEPTSLDDRRAAKSADAGPDGPGMTQAEADAFSRPIDCPPPVTMRHDQIFQPNPGLISAIKEHDSEIQAARPPSSPLRPLGDRVVVLPDPPESTTAGGLVIPAQAQDRPRRGTVLAVGPGKSLMSGLIQPIDIHPGQRVAYATYGGTELDDVIVLREDERRPDPKPVS